MDRSHNYFFALFFLILPFKTTSEENEIKYVATAYSDWADVLGDVSYKKIIVILYDIRLLISQYKNHNKNLIPELANLIEDSYKNIA